MKIFFDFDGTLIDSRQRLYHLFQYLVKDSDLSFEEYWSFKRNKISHAEILSTKFGYNEFQLAEFHKNWLLMIERPEWIEHDSPFPGVSKYLATLSKTKDLYLVTSRQFESVVFDQINKFGWDNLFKGIFVTGQIKEKYDLISSKVDLSESDWFIGDTGKDVQTGKQLGINTAAVLCGFLSQKILEEYCPDILVQNVVELVFE